jgi:Chaperone of endosialidase
MKIQKHLTIVLSMVFAFVCLNASVFGQDDKNRFAAISGSGASVKWDVSATYSELTLAVSAPDGQVFRRAFKAGTSPFFRLADEQGNRLPDGTYTYELRLAPVLSASVKEELAAGRARGEASGDDAAVEREMRKRGSLPAPQVQSGSFLFMNGTVLVGASGEGSEPQQNRGMMQPQQPQRPVGVRFNPVTARRMSHLIRPGILLPDDVIPDDLIVQGSACVGLDCVSGEAFGFDTIRLKENNTRIQFDDTSSTQGYPTNNWQIRANSSDSGGDSFIGFVDQSASGNSETGTLVLSVEAGAPANSVSVDNTGRLGLKTSTPVLDIHVNTSNTPAIRLEQNNSGGFTAQTWDIAGNEANFFIRDVTGGSRLPFRIRPGAPTSSIDINAVGKVGIGSASPQIKVDIKQSEDTFLGGLGLRRNTTSDVWAIATGGDNNLYFGYANNASGGNAVADFTVFPLILTTNDRVGIGTTAPDQKLSVNGDASKTGGGSWQVFSDERLKSIKGRFTSGLSAVMQLQPLRYEYRPNNALGLNSNGEHVGFGAQALQRVIPEAVTMSDKGYLLVNNDPIIWTMLNAIKEQQKEIEQLRAEIRQLQPRARRANRPRRR